MIKTRLIASVFVVAILGMGACSKAPVIPNMYQDPEYHSQFKHILVAGVASDREGRESFENDFALFMRKNYIAAVTSYALFPGDDRDQRVSDEQIAKVMANQRIDGVITVRAIVGPQITDKAFGSLWDAQQGAAGRNLRKLIIDPWPAGDYHNNDFVVEVALWDVSTYKQIWAGTSQVLRPGGEDRPKAKEFFDHAVQAMKEGRLL